MQSAGKKIYWFVAAVDRNNAGYRVRALPLAKGLEEGGMAIEILPLDQLPGRLDSIIADAGVVICSKPSTPEIFLCLQALKAREIGIVLDLFDNYFSWSPSLEARQIPTQWLKFVDLADHILVSTPFLRGVIRRITDTPTTLIGDPAPATRPCETTNADRTRKWPVGDVLQVLWYGINGNPFFKAGLDDLVSWKQAILSLERRLGPGRRLFLTICTNPTPLLTGVLEQFRNAGIEAVYQRWTEEGCDSLLDSTHLVLLPTNLTGFSLSKTHNRCSDALAKDCLILCSPGGPYVEIPGAVFTELDGLTRLLHRRDRNEILKSIQTSQSDLASRYELTAIVARLAETIGNLSISPVEFANPRIVIFGQATDGTANTVSRLNRLPGSPRYLTAGTADATMSHKLDICLTVGRPAEEAIDLSLTPDGREALVEALDRQEGKRPETSTFRFDESGQRCRVSIPAITGLAKQIGALRGSHDRHGTLIAEWFSLHTEMITMILRSAGFSDLEFATHAEAGWKHFAAQADRPLELLLENHREQSVRFENREFLMGCLPEPERT